jgi:glutamyl/glutaminyl-tRNA synthetase
MDITHVIRGDDHLSNTPRQLYLYDALGWEPPKWCHLAMILGEDGDRLSKRHGATDVEEYREEGFLPEAMLNALALLGWSPPDGVEYKSVDELIESFELDRVSTSSSQFDLDKFRYLNGQHLRDLDASEIVDRMRPNFLPDALEPGDEDRLERIVEVLRDHLTLLSDFGELYETFFQEPIEPSSEAVDWIRDHEEAVDYLEAFRDRLQAVDELDPETAKTVIGDAKDETGGSGRDFYLPLRIGITGRMEGPEFHEIMPVIGTERCLNRLDILLTRVS